MKKSYIDYMNELEDLQKKYQINSFDYEDIYINMKKNHIAEKNIEKFIALLLMKENEQSFASCVRKAKLILQHEEKKTLLKEISIQIEKLKENDKVVTAIKRFLNNKEVNYIENLVVPCEFSIQSSYVNLREGDFYKFRIVFQNEEDFLSCNEDVIPLLVIGANYSSIEMFQRLQLCKIGAKYQLRTLYEEIKDKMWCDKYVKRKLLSDIEFLQTRSVYEDFINLIKALQLNIETEFVKATESALYLLAGIIYREEKFDKLKSLKQKYGLSEENDLEAVRVMYKKGCGVPEILEVVALMHYFYDDKYWLTYKDMQDCLYEPVCDTINIVRAEHYLNATGNSYGENKTIFDTDMMSGVEFEDFVSEIFEKLGFETQKTKTTGDQGVDIIATKNEIVIAIQTKCYKNIVGNHAIMEAVGGMKYYNANRCAVITNSIFSKSARELAKANNVELWDREVLKEKIDLVNEM